MSKKRCETEKAVKLNTGVYYCKKCNLQSNDKKKICKPEKTK